jgi:hypothetical protein
MTSRAMTLERPDPIDTDDPAEDRLDAHPGQPAQLVHDFAGP